MNIVIQLVLGFVISALIGALAYLRQSLTAGGVAGAVIVGTLTFGLGGLGVLEFAAQFDGVCLSANGLAHGHLGVGGPRRGRSQQRSARSEHDEATGGKCG